MILDIPGSKLKIRFFERVETVDDQYDIFDCGAVHSNGDIDSLVVGGSFATVKNLAGDADKKAAKRDAKKASKKAKKEAKAEAAAVQADVEADANLSALKTEVVEPMVTAPEDLVAA